MAVCSETYMAAREEITALKAANNHLAKYARRMEEESAVLREAAKQAVDALSIIDESEGVAGWHLSGEVSPWDEGDLPSVRDALNKALTFIAAQQLRGQDAGGAQ